MINIEFRFPGGRYHATPWGHHVNEGLVEWPPSPWRLVRAFIATAYTKLHYSDPVPAENPLHNLVKALASAAPSYFAAPCPATHSRHYMPMGGKDGKTTLVLDTCAVPGSDPLIVSWPIELEQESRELLDRVVTSLSYLGRAESWVEGRLLPEYSNIPDLHEITPHEEGMNKGPGWEQLSLLAPTSAEAYAHLFAEFCRQVEVDHPLSEGKTKPDAALRKMRSAALEPFPTDLFDCLTRDTAFFQKQGWSQPPGSRRVLYWRRAQSLTTAPLPQKRPASGDRPVQAVLLALASDPRHREDLPLLSRALPQAEILHRALASKAGNGRAISCPVLIGKDANGRPMIGHQHLHILPLNLDLNQPGRLDHFLLWAPMGFNEHAQQAIMGVRQTWTKGFDKPLIVTAAGTGVLGDFNHLLGKSTVGPSCTWESITPFVPPRFLKKNGVHTLEGQIRSELACRGLDAKIEFMTREEVTGKQLHRYVRTRDSEGKAPPQDCFFGVRLVFEKEISGPLTLGYGSHFGLGLFAPVPTANASFHPSRDQRLIENLRKGAEKNRTLVLSPDPVPVPR